MIRRYLTPEPRLRTVADLRAQLHHFPDDTPVGSVVLDNVMSRDTLIVTYPVDRVEAMRLRDDHA